MNETVKLLLSLSLSGSILALLIFTLKPLIKHKLSRTIQYYIWIVVLLRLVTPFSFEDSLMSDVFFSDNNTPQINNQITVQPMEVTTENTSNLSILPNVQENVAGGVYNNDVDHTKYLTDVLNRYVLYIWLFGVITALTVNLVGYIRFLNNLKQGYRAATDEENSLLATLLNGRRHVKLVRNKFVATPMLMGILRPSIIIPDVNYSEKELKNILLHEVSHLKHFDIGVKWLTMITTSVHWFNPLMYFVKKEINRACELACDEAVIKNLSPAEKQAYGDTLISVIAKHKYPASVLQATMCEEKKSLKERLLAIMHHQKKSRLIMVLSVVLLGGIIIGALYLGAGVGEKVTPPDVVRVDMMTYDISEIAKYKTPYIGDASKVSHIAGLLPVPDRYFTQRFISMETSNKPYRLTIYYEPANNTEPNEVWPIATRSSAIEANTRKNALVVFSMIDNLDEVTFAFRNYQSDGKLDEAKYVNPYTFKRLAFEEVYGDLSALGENLDLLQEVLLKKTSEKGTQTVGQFSHETVELVENNLKIIMSSPKTSSNPRDYIREHQNEYETILKYGNKEVLVYMLSQFKEGDAEGLRGEILMRLCKELLGQQNNVTDESLSPMEWYEKLNLREEITLSDFSYDGKDPIEKLVYETEVQKHKSSRGGFTIVAPHIFGSYEEGNKLKVFVTTYSARYRLYDKVLSEDGGAIIPAAITYVKNSNGSYSLDEYQRAEDGAHFGSSIIEFCTMPVSGKNIKGLADKMLNHYGNYEDIKKLQRKNLIKHLNTNNQYGVSLYQTRYKQPDELVPLT